ncbi:MAG: porphobilinogen synthase [Fimbriimonas sp.]|nr:porphobilinogen synthase [Fimbriimonas sp.]
MRRNESLRKLVRETHVQPSDLIYPIFVREGQTEPEPILSMPGQYRLPINRLSETAKEVEGLGIGALLIFGLPSRKDDGATSCYDPNGVVQQAIREVKKATPNLVVMTDVCVCAYMGHGHCGVLNGQEIDNDATLPLLARMALSHARAGADVVAPSSMMDEQVGAIRTALDTEGLKDTAVMAYSAKFSSAFYGPFREAADSAPSFGDRASYQHDYANPRHARRELLQDIEEGADILMVKPGLAYLDVVLRARELSDLPIAAYAVSGEYSMIKAAAERGWLDEKKIVLETLTAFRRAGADLIITYHAKEASTWLNNS